LTGRLPPSRHDLVWLRPRWRGSLLSSLSPDAAALAQGWLDRGLPAVTSRLDARAAAGAVTLGIALPPAPERRRVSFTVAWEAVAAVARPLRLCGVLRSAPAPFQPALESLCADARAVGLSLGVYGSLAWQHLSGDPYLREGSDVDLLVEPQTQSELSRALELLGSRASLSRPRLDGELVLGGCGFSWRELLSSPRRVLMKSPASVSLVSLSEVLGWLGSAEGAR